MKVALTFVYLFLATLTSVIAYPLQRRDFTQLSDALDLLNTHVTEFNHYIPDDGILDLVLLEPILGPILLLIAGDYQTCSDILAVTPLSNSEGLEFVKKYEPISNSFSNGLNTMSTAQKNAPSSKGVLGNLVTLINRVGNAVNKFLGTVNGPNVPAQNANELKPSNSELQSALQNAASV